MSYSKVNRVCCHSNLSQLFRLNHIRVNYQDTEDYVNTPFRTLVCKLLYMTQYIWSRVKECGSMV